VETQQLSGTIHLPGLTRNAWAALSAMDVFVLPSRLEGLPNVLIEAQAMGVPVICSGAGGMAETFVEGETGFAVPSASAEALAAAVGRLIDDKELRRRMSAAAETHAREKFSIDRMIGLTIEAYADTPLETSRSV
jgi:glycosyltransferase involved in cell wall biosynthesis